MCSRCVQCKACPGKARAGPRLACAIAATNRVLWNGARPTGLLGALVAVCHRLHPAHRPTGKPGPGAPAQCRGQAAEKEVRRRSRDRARARPAHQWPFALSPRGSPHARVRDTSERAQKAPAAAGTYGTVEKLGTVLPVRAATRRLRGSASNTVPHPAGLWTDAACKADGICIRINRINVLVQTLVRWRRARAHGRRWVGAGPHHGQPARVPCRNARAVVQGDPESRAPANGSPISAQDRCELRGQGVRCQDRSPCA